MDGLDRVGASSTMEEAARLGVGDGRGVIDELENEDMDRVLA